MRGETTVLPTKWTDNENLDGRLAFQSVEYADG